MPFTTADFLTSVRQRGSIPTTTNASNVNNTTNLLSLATEELHIKLLPLLLSVREEFYVYAKDYTVTADQAAYAIPTRTAGATLRDIQWIEGNNIRSLPRVDSDFITSTASGTVQGYYLQHNDVILYPTPSSTTGTLRLRYYLRPGRLAATTACAQITAVTTTTVTVASIPSSWAVGTIVDFIKATPPFHYPSIDQTITALAGTTITFAAVASTVVVGDWLALAEYSPIPQIPFEFQPVLAQMTVVKALEAIGDREGSAAARKDLEVLQASALALMSPRVSGEAKKVIGRNWR